MPVASAGNIVFGQLRAFKEATPGTIPTLTSGGRKLLTGGIGGVISPNTTIELGADRSVALRNPLIATTGTIVSVEPTLSVSVPAISIGELPVWLSMTKTVTPGTASPYAWDYNYSMTTANSPTSYTLVATDGLQQYAVNYCLAESITIAADRSGLTSLSANLFGQTIAKNSATLAASTPTSPFMAGRLWNCYQSGTVFPGTASGTAFTYLLDYSLEFNAGVTKQAYLAGTTSFSTHSESNPFTGTLSMTVSSTADAVSVWYDAYQAATPVGVRLTWSSGAYSAHILCMVVPTEVQPMAGAEDGLTTYAVTGTLVYETTSAKSLQIVVNSDLSVLP